jgi:hypothetical protein
MTTWIKVSERLPSIGDNGTSKVVLIYNKTRGWALGYLLNGKWFNASEGLTPIKPSHWAEVTSPDTRVWLGEMLKEAVEVTT